MSLENQLMSTALQKLSEVQTPVTPAPAKLPHDDFGLDVAETLRKMSDDKAAFAKIKIQEILYTINYQTF